ncbi:hypothetical protein BJY01DRAFT_259354 [Aspergillus pseudoustus]|uniref:Uncharacterized protein n=1 Tax=Aspergillus pseudoustus TaxID=1810923 RepID=A0ABR4J445_9EURO
MTYQLSISLFGSGVNDPAHWGFVIHQPPNEWGTLMHVRTIDERLNIFQFEHRNPHTLTEQDAWGICRLATLSTTAERLRVAKISEHDVPPPRGGTDNCQNWVVDALVALKVEEVVANGTTAVWAARIGVRTRDIKMQAGAGGWDSLNGK